MATLADVEDMLKEVWPATFETIFSNEIVTLTRIESTNRDVFSKMSARYAYVPIRVGRTQAIGSATVGVSGTGETAAWPEPDSQKWDRAQVQLVKQWGTADISVDAMKLVDSDPRAFINALDQELQGLQEDLLYDYSRQIHGTPSGRLCSGSGTVTDNGDGTYLVAVSDIQYVEKGMRLDAYGGTLAALEAGTLTKANPTGWFLITAIGTSPKTITVAHTGGLSGLLVTGTTYHFRRKLNGGGSYLSDLAGFGYLVDDGTTYPSVQGLSSASLPAWRSPKITVSPAGPYTERVVVQACNATRREVGAAPSVFFTGLGGRTAIFEVMRSYRQINDSLDLGGGFTGLPFSYGGKNIPIVEDPRFPEEADASTGAGKLLGLNENDITLYQEGEGWHFADEGGSMFFPATDRSDKYEMRMRKYSQCAITRRNSHCYITGFNL